MSFWEKWYRGWRWFAAILLAIEVVLGRWPQAILTLLCYIYATYEERKAREKRITSTEECPSDCKLCDVQRRIEAHYHGCATCKLPDGECAEMASLWEEQEKATDELFPETITSSTNGSIGSATVTYAPTPPRHGVWRFGR